MSRDELLSHFCEAPSIWGGKQNPPCSALQKVRGSLTWWWHLLLLHCLTITLSQSLVLVFFCLFLRTSLLTSLLTSSHLSSMCIKIWRPMISSSFLKLSRGSFATSLSPFLILLTMLACATHWLYLHLYTLANMSMQESCLLVCCPCFNTMKLWTFDPNLHLSPVDTTFWLFACFLALSAFLFVFLSCLIAFNWTIKTYSMERKKKD